MNSQLLVTFLVVSCLSLAESNWYAQPEGGACLEPEIEHGVTEPRAEFFTRLYAIGTRITITCDEGYTLNGPDYAYCKVSGTFGKLSKCIADVEEKTVCELPKMDDDIYVQPRKAKYGVNEIVTFDCTGYKKIDGHSVSRCAENGQFDPPPPSCVAPRCDPVSPPENGWITPARMSYAAGTVVSIKCAVGYKLVGDVNATCDEDGKFSKFSAVCASVVEGRYCNLPPQQYRVVFIRPKPQYKTGETLSYVCRPGYKVVGDGNLVCLPSIGWSEKPKCQRTSCVRPFTPLNGRFNNVKKLFYKFGQKIKYICNQGYEIEGETDELVCGNDGNFYPSPPICRRSNRRPVTDSTCRGRCGSSKSFGGCRCDDMCQQYRDCCPDYTSYCPDH